MVNDGHEHFTAETSSTYTNEKVRESEREYQQSEKVRIVALSECSMQLYIEYYIDIEIYM